MKKILPLLLLFTASAHGQDWISISNEYIRISLDTQTGRYIISESDNSYPPAKAALTNWPAHLKPASPGTDSNISRSALAGSLPNAANTAMLNINGSPVFFGSAPGVITPAPKADPAAMEITCNWRLGNVDVTQILRIITNKDTLLMDAVSISYNILNKTEGVQRIGAKLILDPIPGDGQAIPFRIAGGRNVLSETRFTRADMPEYWFSTDRGGELSPYTIRGLLRNTGMPRPDSAVFTTLENALKARWDHYLNTAVSLAGTDTAVTLSFDPQEVGPGEGRTVGTVLGISGIISGQNQGLKVNVSAFSKQDTNPAVIGLWLTNSSREIFDQVFLEITVPPVINVLSSPRQEILSVGSGEERYAEWILASTTDAPGTYNAVVNVLGRRNGEDLARIPVPFTITWASNSVRGEGERIQQALSNGLALAQADLTAPAPAAPLPSIVLADGFNAGETLGPTTESLTKLRDSLKNSSLDNVEDIITLIDSELQLIKEIAQTQRNIAEIDQQYAVLRRVYRQLYESASPVDDRLPINLQGIRDNLSSSEKQLKEQEKMLDGILKTPETGLQNTR